jgi:hypothetical protein
LTSIVRASTESWVAAPATFLTTLPKQLIYSVVSFGQHCALIQGPAVGGNFARVLTAACSASTRCRLGSSI